MRLPPTPNRLALWHFRSWWWREATLMDCWKRSISQPGQVLKGSLFCSARQRVVGLALVADAPGRLPKPLTELCHLVAGGYARVWDVPWVEAWRLGDTPTLANTPKQVGRMAREICVIVAKPKMDQGADTLERELGRTQSQR